MKKIASLLIAFALGATFANATPVKAIVAQKIAEKFYTQISTQPLTTATLTYTEMSSTGEVVYYVFNVNNGFVVVAADDKELPIISFSTQGKFNAPKPKSNVVIIDKWAATDWAATTPKG
jgi:hypothetical protein